MDKERRKQREQLRQSAETAVALFSSMTPGVALKAFYHNSGIAPYLEDLATKMDAWTVEECTNNNNRVTILNDLKTIFTESKLTFKLGTLAWDLDQILVRAGGESAIPYVPVVRIKGVGGNLSILLSKLRYPDCTGCNELGSRMNHWGPEGCLERMGAIIDEMHKRSKEYKLFWPGRIVVKVVILLAIKMTKSIEKSEEFDDARINKSINSPELLEWKENNKRTKDARRTRKSPQKRG